jgi:hypothetical protein
MADQGNLIRHLFCAHQADSLDQTSTTCQALIAADRLIGRHALTKATGDIDSALRGAQGAAVEAASIVARLGRPKKSTSFREGIR